MGLTWHLGTVCQLCITNLPKNNIKMCETLQSCRKIETNWPGTALLWSFSLKRFQMLPMPEHISGTRDGITHGTFPFFNHHKCHANLANPAIFMPIMEISEIKIQISEIKTPLTNEFMPDLCSHIHAVEKAPIWRPLSRDYWSWLTWPRHLDPRRYHLLSNKLKAIEATT